MKKLKLINFVFTVKLIIFVIIWGVTFGRHHFWIFPNLTEDVGFFESFWPLYQYENKSGSAAKDESGDDSSKTGDSADLPTDKKKNKSKKSQERAGQEEKELLLKQNEDDEEDELEEQPASEASENDSVENNGFEIVNNKDVPEILNLKL